MCRRFLKIYYIKSINIITFMYKNNIKVYFLKQLRHATDLKDRK